MSRGSLSFCKGKKINQECYLVTNWGLFDKISYILYLTEAKGQFLKAESSIGGLPKAGGHFLKSENKHRSISKRRGVSFKSPIKHRLASNSRGAVF